jgi:hypothetical protein
MSVLFLLLMVGGVLTTNGAVASEAPKPDESIILKQDTVDNLDATIRCIRLVPIEHGEYEEFRAYNYCGHPVWFEGNIYEPPGKQPTCMCSERRCSYRNACAKANGWTRPWAAHKECLAIVTVSSEYEVARCK